MCLIKSKDNDWLDDQPPSADEFFLQKSRKQKCCPRWHAAIYQRAKDLNSNEVEFFFFLKQVDSIQLSAGNQWIYREMNSAFCWINCWPCKTEATEKPCQVWGSLNQSEVSSAKVFLTMVVWDSGTNGGRWGCWLNPTCGDAAQSGAHASSLLLRPRQSGTFPTELNPPSFIKSRFSSTLFGHHRSQCCVSNLSPHRLG